MAKFDDLQVIDLANQCLLGLLLTTILLFGWHSPKVDITVLQSRFFFQVKWFTHLYFSLLLRFCAKETIKHISMASASIFSYSPVLRRHNQVCSLAPSASGSFYQSGPNSRICVSVLMYSICFESCTSPLLLHSGALNPSGTSQRSS